MRSGVINFISTTGTLRLVGQYSAWWASRLEPRNTHAYDLEISNTSINPSDPTNRYAGLPSAALVLY